LNREEPHKEIEDVLEVAMAIRNEKRTPKVPEDVPDIFKEVIKLCWADDPSERPVRLSISNFTGNLLPN
jgi:hypothetical protein